MNPPDWKGKSKDLILEASRHGEAKLQAQVQIATSADQRATILAGIYVAAATGIIGALATNAPLEGARELMAGGAIAAILFLLGAFLCICATLPTDFWTPGNDPSEWYGDIEKGKSIEEAAGEQAVHFDAAIKANDKVLVRNARLFLWGALCGIGAPVVGLFAAGLICLAALGAA